MTQAVQQPDAQSLSLQSERLAVEISQPGSYYCGSRFDWTSFITQVTLDGKHTFCAAESLKPGKGTGGAGLCNEFGIDKPVGYADAQPGETFPKLGVGLLKRPAAPDYSYLRSHEIVQRFPVNLNATPNQLNIEVEPIECRGYSLRMHKTIQVKSNWLSIETTLENTGSKPVDTHEYRHNFIGIDKQLLGSDYRLHLPNPIVLEDITDSYRSLLPAGLRKVIPNTLIRWLINRLLSGLKALVIEGGDVGFRYTPKAMFYFRTTGFKQSDNYQWEIRLLSTGTGVREYDDFLPARLAVWGDTHVMSAETFIDLALQPGEGKTWTRKYEFFAGG